MVSWWRILWRWRSERELVKQNPFRMEDDLQLNIKREAAVITENKSLFQTIFPGGSQQVYNITAYDGNGIDALLRLHDRQPYRGIIIIHDPPHCDAESFAQKIRSHDLSVILLCAIPEKDAELALSLLRFKVDALLLTEEVTAESISSTMQMLFHHNNHDDEEMNEVHSSRISAMRSYSQTIIHQLENPVHSMQQSIRNIAQNERGGSNSVYWNIIEENVERMVRKIVKLLNLNTDRTIQYIKNIKMIDIS
jgi:signal transduction histidine kinase